MPPPSPSPPSSFDLWLKSPASPDDLPPTSPPLILDLFPSEIRVRIASFVSQGRQTPEILALACTNKIQCSAVLQALQHHFDLFERKDGNIVAKWLSVFRNDIKELTSRVPCLSDPVWSFWELKPDPWVVFKTDTLRKVTLFIDQFDFEGLLAAMENSTSICELKVHFRGNIVSKDFWDILNAVGSLKSLKSLELICADVDICWFDSSLDLSTVELAPSLARPDLKALHIHCPPHNNKHSNRDYVLLHSLKHMPAVEEVTLNQTPPDAMLPLLDGVRDIRLPAWSEATFGKAFLPRLAHRISEISTDFCFEQDNGAQLALCVRVRKFCTTLKSGSEVALGKVLRQMEELRELKLEWQRSGGYDEEGSDVVRLIVDSAPRVEVLMLSGVRISMKDIASILSGVGHFLRELEMDILGQEELPLKRIQGILELVMVHCTGLRRFSITNCMTYEHQPLSWLFTDEWEFRNGENLCTQLRDVVRVHKHVKQRLPMFYSRDVDCLIECATKALVHSSSSSPLLASEQRAILFPYRSLFTPYEVGYRSVQRSILSSDPSNPSLVYDTPF